MAIAWTKWRTRAHLGAAVFVILIQVINGYEELYTISQLSPKSVSEDSLPRDAVLQTRQADNIAFRIEPSRYDDDDDIPAETIIDDEEREKHVIVARSADLADRESRSINIDEIPISNHNEIDGDLELYNKRKYYDIHPTKTMADLQDRQDKITPSENFGDRLNFRFPGEVNRVPNARALASGPKIRPTAVQPIFATATHKEQGRQNTEIQNIITGIVKLLNGNVNVQANTQLLRPGRPMNSRINNRGPPRISDVPPLPDFDKPITPPPHSFVPTKLPPPYPFDRPPHHGVNLPEQIVPPLNPSRPGFHRPHPPWSRPRPRPPNRRPIPGLPMYKPMPPVPHDIPDLDDAKPEEDITVSENETSHSENHLLHDENLPLSLPVPTAPVNEDHEDKITTMEEETTSSTSTTTELTTTSTTTEKPTEKPTTEEPTTTTEKPTTTTKKPTTTTKKPTTTTEKLTTKAKPTTTTTEKPKTEKPIKPDKKKDTYNAEKDKPNKEKHKLEEKVTNKTKTNSIIEGIFENITPPFSGIKPTMAVIDISTPTPNVGIVEQISHTPVESSMVESVFHTPSVDTQPLPSTGLPYHPYRPRPGIVLDDPDFKPHGTRFRPEASVITAAETRLPPGYGEIFDVTVSAIQGPGEKGGSVHIETVHPLHHGEHDDIIVSATGEQGFVSIDGKRTYLNLFDSSTVDASPTQHVQHNTAPPSLGAIGTGVAIPADDELPPPRHPSHPPHSLHPSHSSPHPTHPHPLHPNRQSPARPQQGYRRPQPTVRIDTCIVGDDSTCDQAQNEKCRTEAGISSCQCRPGFARRTHRDPCRRVVALVLNLRVDRIYDRKMAWDAKLADKESEPYQQLNYEAMRAVDSAFSMTPFSDDFVSCSLNAVHTGDDLHRGIYVNFTVLLQESPETLRHQISSDVQKHLLGVIRRRSNNVGASNLWVHSPTDSVLPLTDLDECASSDFNDCHHLATCTNTWGGFRCLCPDTTLDSSPLPGRDCKACAASHCNDRGVCRYRDKQPYCSCTSGYYGSTCVVDGEVVGVAVGASLAAALVIALTLAALLSWSRKWSREQKAIGMGSPVFNYMAANTIKTPPVGQPPYQVSIEERMRWAQIAEAMAQSNHYAPDPAQTMVTRPSSAMFGGYPTLPPVPMPRMGLHNPHMGTLNTVASRANTAASHHNMYGYTNHMATESTSSEASSHVQERADLLVPRPKSRARSMHNQSNIYYDVEYENAPEAIYGTKGIPLSTYTISRGPPFYRS